ncbi:uncharacterized protein LOC123531921 [Mercenaria mercenaria]|uniref:uncharacterized protein LOC123531921 n=1 Tax=Mercenaria mercenaria TaxID=6596 RepID=UPI001E1DD99D|nr:uncharacterized protein LOC123531921 [Mercenaria mercenaria]
MDTKGNVENTSDQPLSPEQYAEFKEDYGTTEIPISQQPIRAKDNRDKKKNIGAVRMAGFLFWLNFAGVLLLLVGFVAPGWLTAKTDQKLYRNSYSYDSGTPLHLYNVYQDYALWYITQCYEHDGRNTVCETMTYRTIDDVYGEEKSDYEKIEIGEMEKVGDDRFMFHGAGLVFSYSEVVRVETLYTIGLLIALFTLYKFYQFRAGVTDGKRTILSKLKWALLLILTVLSVVLVLVPVFMFVLVRGKLEKDYHSDVYTPFGSVFAGIGGGIMALVPISIFMQLVCCRNTDEYICSCTDESDVVVAVEDD